jgi:hypothetical protein
VWLNNRFELCFSLVFVPGSIPPPLTGKKIKCIKNYLKKRQVGEITGNYRQIIGGSSPAPGEIAAPPASKKYPIV